MTSTTAALPGTGREDLLVPATDATLTNAMNAAWTTIRELHPDVPEAVVTITRGRESSCSAAAVDTSPRVIELSPAVLQRGPEDVFAVLLHPRCSRCCRDAGRCL
jgi:hypothetical protein